MDIIKEDIINFIVEHIRVNHVENDQITNEDLMNSKFTELGMDSLDVIELVMNVEKEFEVDINEITAGEIISSPNVLLSEAIKFK